jgi:hypothetical protein
MQNLKAVAMGMVTARALGMSVTLIQVDPPGYFVYISITMPIVSALKKLLCLELSRSPNGFLKVLLGPGGGFKSETAVTKPFRK